MTDATRSPEYDDGLTIQDTSHSAAPRTTDAAVPGTVTADSDTLSSDETSELISADKVIGTVVYDAAGDRLGTIDSVMLGKRSGQVAYAVMSFGGFLGIGERFHPLPWNVLTYDTAKGGYNVQHSADDLRGAPHYNRDEVDAFDYGRRSGEIDNYYGVAVPHRDRPAGQTPASAHATSADRISATPTPSERSGGMVPNTATGIEAADAIGSTTGAGSSGMGSTGMGSNRNF